MPTIWFPRVNSKPPLWSEEISRKMMDLSAPQLAIWTLFSTPGLGGIFKNRMAVMLLEWSSKVWRKLYSLDMSKMWINRSLEAEANKLQKKNEKLFYGFNCRKKEEILVLLAAAFRNLSWNRNANTKMNPCMHFRQGYQLFFF